MREKKLPFFSVLNIYLFDQHQSSTIYFYKFFASFDILSLKLAFLCDDDLLLLIHKRTNSGIKKIITPKIFLM